MIVDLTPQQRSHQQVYEPLWELCKRYIVNSIELAIDDRQHDCITHLVISLSVNDLLSEVSKRVGTDVPVPSAQWVQLRFLPNPPTTNLQYTAKTALQYTG